MSIYAVNGKTPINAWIPSRDTAGNGTTTLTDLVGSSNGTLTNMDAATDWVADTGAGGIRALDFDGTNQYVLAPSINYPSISISLWVRFFGDSSHVYIAKRSNTSYSWEIGRSSITDRVLVRINDNANVASGGVLSVDTWHHIVGTYDGANIKAYIDGNLVATTAYSTAITTSSVQTTLAARALFPGAEEFFPLRLDDIRIFDQALNAADALALFAGGRGKIDSGRNVAMMRRRRMAGGGLL
jgi:hypothetical protein